MPNQLGGDWHTIGGDKLLSGKVSLTQHRISRDGYDSRGKYWGIGPKLWRASDDYGNDYYVRAETRELAKGKIMVVCHGVTFFR